MPTERSYADMLSDKLPKKPMKEESSEFSPWEKIANQLAVKKGDPSYEAAEKIKKSFGG